MVKADLVEVVAQQSELKIKDAEIVVNEIFQSLIDALQSGDEIELRGFGCFRQRQRNIAAAAIQLFRQIFFGIIRGLIEKLFQAHVFKPVRMK